MRNFSIRREEKEKDNGTNMEVAKKPGRTFALACVLRYRSFCFGGIGREKVTVVYIIFLLYFFIPLSDAPKQKTTVYFSHALPTP